MRSQLCARKHQRVRDIISIAYKCYLQAVNAALGLPDGQIIGQRLAGMAVVGQSVDYGNAGVFRHLLDDLVSEGSDHDPLNHALQILGHVVDGLALAEINFGWGQVERESAELLNSHVEADARAQRRLFEDHRQCFAVQGLAVGCRMGLYLAAENQAGIGFRRAKNL